MLKETADIPKCSKLFILQYIKRFTSKLSEKIIWSNLKPLQIRYWFYTCIIQLIQIKLWIPDLLEAEVINLFLVFDIVWKYWLLLKILLIYLWYSHILLCVFNIKLQVSIAVALEEALFYVVIYNHDIKNRSIICQSNRGQIQWRK